MDLCDLRTMLDQEVHYNMDHQPYRVQALRRVHVDDRGPEGLHRFRAEVRFPASVWCPAVDQRERTGGVDDVDDGAY